jgi:hypothetical protein
LSHPRMIVERCKDKIFILTLFSVESTIISF